MENRLDLRRFVAILTPRFGGSPFASAWLSRSTILDSIAVAMVGKRELVKAVEKICVLEEIDASTVAALGLPQLQASSPEIDKTYVTTRQRFVLGKIDACLLDLGIRLVVVVEKICTGVLSWKTTFGCCGILACRMHA